jgi:hypothetical protein
VFLLVLCVDPNELIPLVAVPSELATPNPNTQQISRIFTPYYEEHSVAKLVLTPSDNLLIPKEPLSESKGLLFTPILKYSLLCNRCECQKECTDEIENLPKINPEVIKYEEVVNGTEMENCCFNINHSCFC